MLVALFVFPDKHKNMKRATQVQIDAAFQRKTDILAAYAEHVANIANTITPESITERLTAGARRHEVIDALFMDRVLARCADSECHLVPSAIFYETGTLKGVLMFCPKCLRFDTNFIDGEDVPNEMFDQFVMHVSAPEIVDIIKNARQQVALEVARVALRVMIRANRFY